MFRGFIGASATHFVSATNESMSAAIDVHNINPFEGLQAGEGIRADKEMTLLRLREVQNRRLPFSTEGATRASHRIGVGNSSNMVVSEDTYDDIAKRASILDDQVCEELYKVADEIEQMCASIFVVPETVPRLLEATGQFKRIINSSRSITEDTIILTRRFVNEMIQIDERRR